MVLMFDAPSESKDLSFNPRENLQFILATLPEMLAPEVTLQIVGKASPIPIRVLCHRLVIKRSNGHNLRKISS
jgi:hypothetical protein